MISADKNIFEVVLPKSGRFARVERIRWYDMLLAGLSTRDNPEVFIAELAARVATIDGAELDRSKWLEQDYEDIWPVSEELVRRLKKAQPK